MRSMDSVMLLGDERKNWLRGKEIPLAAIAAYFDLFNEEYEAVMDKATAKREEALRLHWKDGLSYLADAGPQHGQLVYDAYMHTVIPVSTLKNLPSATPQGVLARRTVINDGGFLHVSPPDVQRYLPPKGICKIIRNSGGQDVGFYTILTEEKDVRAEMQRDLGWDPTVKCYTEQTLPLQSSVGDLTWIRPEVAVQMFNDPSCVALPGDLVILRSGTKRDIGSGKALKVGAYQELRERSASKTITLTRIFEIARVGPTEKELAYLPDPIANKWSRHMNLNLGASLIGYLTERLRRVDEQSGDDVWLEVKWGLYKSSVDGLIETAYYG